MVGESVLTSVRMTWAGAIDYFVDTLLNGGQWPTTSSGIAIDYWPGVAEDASVNLLEDFSSRMAFFNVLDLESRLSSMRQGVSPRVFCGPVSNQDGGRVEASAYADQTTGTACNMSQIDAPGSSCCLTDSHMLNEMNYLVEGGFYPSPSDSKWGTFDGFAFSAPPWFPELIAAPQDIAMEAFKPLATAYEPLLVVNPNKVALLVNITKNTTFHAGLVYPTWDVTPHSFILLPSEYQEVKIDMKTAGLKSDKYRLRLLIQAQSEGSLTVTESVNIHATVRAMADRNATHVSVSDGRPTVGKLWVGGVVVEMRDFDGFPIQEESTSQVFAASVMRQSEGSAGSASCTRRWSQTKYEFDCNVPSLVPAGNWDIKVTLDEAQIFQTTVHVKCPVDTYEHPESWLCKPCPQGTRCVEAGIRLQSLPLLPGYWREQRNSSYIQECAYKSKACPGEGLDENNASLRCADQSEMYCACGYYGPLCSECATRHFKTWAKKNECKRCADNNSHGPGAILGAVVLALCVAISVARRKYKQSNGSKCVERARAFVEKARRVFKVGKIKLKQMFVFCQVISLFPDIFETTSGNDAYPAATTTFVSSLRITNLEFLTFVPFGCHDALRLGFYSKLLVCSLLPISVVALLWSYPLVCYTTKMPHRDAEQFASKWSIFLLEMSVPSVVTAASKAFVCDWFESGPRLRAQLTIACDGSSDRIRWGVYSVSFLAIYPLGISLTLFCILNFHRDRINALMTELKRRDNDTGATTCAVDLVVHQQRAEGETASFGSRLKARRPSSVLSASELTEEIAWLVPKFEHFEPEMYVMGPCLIIIRVLQTGVAVLIHDQIYRLTYVACITLGEFGVNS